VIFVDSNVLVYARDASEVEKGARARAWITDLWQQQAGRLSMQVLNEFYVTVTQKLNPGLDRQTARSDVEDLFAWRPIPISQAVLTTAWSLQDHFRLSWWDALIVSAAQLTGCRYLLSEDMEEGRDYGGIRVVNPFHQQPDSL